MRAFRELLDDTKGASLIEIALIAPIFAAFVVGMTDLSRGYMMKLQLEQAGQRAIEKAMQGKKLLSLYQTLKAEAATAASVPQANVTVKYWLECNGVSQNSNASTMDADFEKVCPPSQTYARYVTVVVSKTYTPMFAKKFRGANANGTFTVTGKSGIRVQ